MAGSEVSAGGSRGAPLDPRLLRSVPALKAAVVGFAGLSALGSVATVAQAAALASVIAAVVDGHAGPSAITDTLAILAVAMAVRAGVAAAGEWLGQTSSLKVRAALRQILLDAAGRAGSRGLDRSDRERIAAALTSGIDSLDGYVTRAVPALVSAMIAPPILLVAIGWTSWLALVLLAVTLPLVPVFMTLIGVATRKHMDRRWIALGRLSGQFLDLLEGLTTLKVYGRARSQVTAVRDGSERLRRETMSTLRVAFASGLVLDLLATLSVALVAVTVGLRLDHGGMQLAPALTVLLLAPEVFAPIRAVGAQHHATEEGRTVGSTVLDLAERVPAGPVGSPEPFTLVPDPTGIVVHLSGARVSYPGRPAPALDGVDLGIRAGAITALTGPSGAGKTTLLAVLLGQVDLSAGAVTVGPGHRERPDGPAWAANVAWVPQRPRLTCADVAGEVRLGDPDLDDEAVAELLRRCDAPVAATPLGEDGRAISAGQRRRVALARAVARAERVAAGGGTALVLLDEPTEDLDRATALTVMSAVTDLARRAAVVVATHDPEVVARAGVEVRLVAGQVQPGGGTPAGADLGRPAGADPVPTRPASAGAVREVAAVAMSGPSGPAEPYERSGRSGGSGRSGPSGPAGPGRVLRRWVWSAVRDTPSAGRRLGQAAGLGALGGLSGLALTATSVWLICRASQHPNVQALAVAVVGVRTFAISKALLRYGERLAAHDGALRLLAGLRVRVFAALEPLAPTGLGDYRRGDLLRRFTSDVDGAQEALVRAAVPLAGSVATALGAVVLCGLLAPATSLALAAGCLIVGLAAALAARAGYRSAPVAATAAGHRDSLATGLVDGLDELGAYGALADRRHQIAAADRAVMAASRRAAGAAAAGSALSGATAAVTLVGVLLAGAGAASGGSLPGVDLGVLAAAVLVAFDSLSALPAALSALGRCASGLSRVDDVLTRPVPVPEPGLLHRPPPLVEQLCGRHLRVAPAPGAPAIIDGADLLVELGQRVAVTGPSGTGKSTLLTALLGLVAPLAGQVEIGGGRQAVPVTAISADLRPRLVAGSLQGDHVFSTTLRDNLRLVAPDATDADLDRVARRAGLGDFMASLPQGWSTQAGPGGSNLSGGQRQRLLLARALLSDPQVLVLDEPTAHLDPETEQAVMADLLDATTGRTVILSTHRAAPLRDCDAVLALRAGRLEPAERSPMGAGLAEVVAS